MIKPRTETGLNVCVYAGVWTEYELVETLNIEQKNIPGSVFAYITALA